MEQNSRHTSAPRRLKWLWLLALVLLLSRPAWAIDNTYNTLGQTYPSYGPTINATNFINPASVQFSLNMTVINNALSLYHGWFYTRNFTNNGEMDCDTGFYFDTQTQNGLLNSSASTFYNSANINCNVALFDGLFFGGIQVWATNIYNSGSIFIGEDGIGRFGGSGLDLTGGSITIDSPFLSQSNSVGFYGEVSGFGLNTNGWDSGISLTPTTAFSSGPFPYVLDLFNSTAYLLLETNNVTSNILVRAVFLLNTTSNTAPANVYFGNNGIGNGSANVEWVASYLNPVDGTVATNYLYLNNDYLLGASTNVQIFNGIPDNFTFFASTVPANAGLLQITNTGFPAGFNYPFNAISNRYSYVNCRLASITVDTNETNPQDFRQLTNLLGRIEITASNALTLSQSTIQGMNYVRFTSTNQYNNDGSSSIITPYADAYLGSTNGSLSVSNLFANLVPGWSGTVQAWSTRWTNGVPDASGYTYEYRVLLVQSAVTPFSESQQQDFVLYSSNNVVISDKLNIMRTLSMNCTNLLLTTNAVGGGAGSFRGELNLNNPALFWASCLPQLRCLTNNGAIRTITAAQYGSAALPYLSFVNSDIISNAGGSYIVANNVQSGGNFNAGTGNFSVQAQTAALTNGMISAGGTFSSTSSSLVIGGDFITADLSLTLTATNLLTDTGVTNGNIWVIGISNTGSSSANGLVLPILPAAGDLLGTTVTNIAVSGTKVTDMWSGHDYGATPAGFSNNAALGQLILDAQGANYSKNGFVFKGSAASGVTNALYVDCLQLLDFADYTNRSNTTNLWLTFSNNMVVYYAQALDADGTSVAEKLNHFNNDHLRWVPSYAGYFSSTNLVYPPGVTNTVNAALAQSPLIDSDGDGNPNVSDSTPFFTPAEVNFMISITNVPPLSVKVQWATVPNGTNFIYYRTNLAAGSWLPFTNFSYYYYGNNVSVTNAAHSNSFISPQPYDSPATNVWVFDVLGNTPHYYQVMVQPWLTYPY